MKMNNKNDNEYWKVRISNDKWKWARTNKNEQQLMRINNNKWEWTPKSENK